MGQPTVCEKCGHLMQLGEWPFCPHGYGSSAAIGDEMDEIIENNGTNVPIRFTSKQMLRDHVRAHGLEPFVRHRPLPGSDKSPHTVDWSKGSIDAQTLDNARVLLSRGTRAADEPAAPSIPIDLTVRELPETFTVKAEP